MSVRAILHYPDPRLREVAAPVEMVAPDVQALVDDMIETMQASSAIGLAATQLGERLAIFVIDESICAPATSHLRVFINPEIVDSRPSVSNIVWTEGCLSFPGIQEQIRRSWKVRIRAHDRDGQPFELAAEGLLAIAIQHEFDHLQGVLLLDHLGPLKKRAVHREMLRQRR